MKSSWNHPGSSCNTWDHSRASLVTPKCSMSCPEWIYWTSMFMICIDPGIHLIIFQVLPSSHGCTVDTIGKNVENNDGECREWFSWWSSWKTMGVTKRVRNAKWRIRPGAIWRPSVLRTTWTTESSVYVWFKYENIGCATSSSRETMGETVVSMKLTRP